MKSLLEKSLVVIILTLSTLATISCKSSPVRTEVKTIYATPELDFPKYPEPRKNVIPYDKDFQKVTDAETEIEYVVMPFWYYKLIVNYKVRVDEQKAKYDAFQERIK